MSVLCRPIELEGRETKKNSRNFKPPWSTANTADALETPAVPIVQQLKMIDCILKMIALDNDNVEQHVKIRIQFFTFFSRALR